MADVIDSLKRLERIGSESSKTVEKIIEAARELAAVIVSAYGADKTVAIQLPNPYGTSQNPNGPLPRRRQFQDYVITDGTLTVLNYSTNKYVAVWHDRQEALRFAEDIAHGLLDLIAEDLEKRQSQNVLALDKLLAARKQQ
jgi:hypothetical protein